MSWFLRLRQDFEVKSRFWGYFFEVKSSNFEVSSRLINFISNPTLQQPLITQSHNEFQKMRHYQNLPISNSINASQYAAHILNTWWGANDPLIMFTEYSHFVLIQHLKSVLLVNWFMVDVCGEKNTKFLQAQKNRLEWFKNQLHACFIVCDVKKNLLLTLLCGWKI